MDDKIKIQLLQRSPLFKYLSLQTLEKVEKMAQLINCQQETTIYHEGEVGNSFYIIIAGKVTLYKEEAGQKVGLDTLETGEYFGEGDGESDGKSRKLTAVASAKTVLFCLPQVLMILLQQDNTVAHSLMQVMKKRQQKIFTNLVSVATGKHRFNQMLPLKDNTTVNKPIPSAKPKPDNLSPSKESVPPATETYLTNKLEELITAAAKAVPQELEKKEATPKGKKIPIEEMLYNRKEVCPCCNKRFTTFKTRSKYVTIDKVDSDFCNYYTGVNPLFYDVSVCTHCGYAFGDDNKEPLGATSIKSIRQVLALLPEKNFAIVRDISLAKETFLMAIMCQTAYENKNSVIARLYLHLAWLYRYEKDSTAENKYLKAALEKYLSAFSAEKFEPKNELQLIYLIGELYNRLGDDTNAVKWFSRLVLHPQKNLFPAIVKKAREQWQDLRNKLKA